MARGGAGEASVGQPADDRGDHRGRGGLDEELPRGEVEAAGDHEVGEVRDRQHRRRQRRQERGHEGEGERSWPRRTGDADVERRQQHHRGIEVEQHHDGGSQRPQRAVRWSPLSIMAAIARRTQLVEEHSEGHGQEQEGQGRGEGVERRSGRRPRGITPVTRAGAAAAAGTTQAGHRASGATAPATPTAKATTDQLIRPGSHAPRVLTAAADGISLRPREFPRCGRNGCRAQVVANVSVKHAVNGERTVEALTGSLTRRRDSVAEITATLPATTRNPIAEVLALPGYRRFWISQLMVSIVSGTIRFAFVWLVLDLTDWSPAVGIMGFLRRPADDVPVAARRRAQRPPRPAPPGGHLQPLPAPSCWWPRACSWAPAWSAWPGWPYWP